MSSEQNDIIRVATRLNLPLHGDVVNVWHFRKTDAVSQSDATTLVDLSEYCDEMFDTIDNYISIDCDFVDINMFNVTQDRPLGSVSWPSLVAGTRTGHPLPMQTAAFLQGNSGFSRNWARKFIGTFSENENDANGFIEGALLSGLAQLGIRWLAGPIFVMTGTWEPVVYHYKAALWRTIVEVVIRNVWATMRRRRAGVGS